MSARTPYPGASAEAHGPYPAQPLLRADGKALHPPPPFYYTADGKLLHLAKTDTLVLDFPLYLDRGMPLFKKFILQSLAELRRQP